MSKKYVWSAAIAAVIAVLTAGTVVIARRTRKDPPPVSPTIPRVEDLPLRPAEQVPTAS
ncbi:hypothetical protein AAFP30_05030 [Gordonia sp. CPCC 205515]|uniref:hypothetical protein n=1 Tax=Gordonia sp. CPCC 205515 TaxID=3140791 RepID=UPI003AF3A014